jgi:hypothetical protein
VGRVSPRDLARRDEPAREREPPIEEAGPQRHAPAVQEERDAREGEDEECRRGVEGASGGEACEAPGEERRERGEESGEQGPAAETPRRRSEVRGKIHPA